MNKNPLQIISVEEKKRCGSPPAKTDKRTERQARFDRIWKSSPEKFDPKRTVMGQERISRTIKLMAEYIDPAGHLAVDLGCAKGHFAFILRDAGADVYAVDISSIALARLKEGDCTHIHPIQDCLPKSRLPDDAYDIVLAADLIACLEPKEYRLFFSELARIINADGYLVCSTPIDLYSENALQNFHDLALTEFDLLKWSFSYHRLHFALQNIFKAPARFIKGRDDPQYRQRAIEKRFSLGKWWYKVNSTALPAMFWSLIQIACKPAIKLLDNNKTLLAFLEKLSRFFWNEAAISHAILIGKRRPIFPPASKLGHRQESKEKKQIWE